MRCSRVLPRRAFTLACTAMVLHAGSLLAQAEAERIPWPDPATTHSEPMPQAKSSLLLDLVIASDNRLIAVGERGHILLSSDRGESWQQATVPTRATLTGVAAAGANVVAVGHDGVIVHSGDGGQTWRLVRDEPYSLDNVTSPSNGSPLLDVVFLDELRVLAIGAYSLLLMSNDGGESWSAQDVHLNDQAADETAVADADAPAADVETATDSALFTEDELLLDDETDPHLNAIARLDDGTLVIAGERGVIYRSTDDAATWMRLEFPYEGSMFGALPLAGNGVVVFGLRGRIFESFDRGDSWKEIDSGTQAALFGGVVGDAGRLTLVGKQGAIATRSSPGGAFAVTTFIAANGETPDLSAIQTVGAGKFWLTGERGMAAWESRP